MVSGAGPEVVGITGRRARSKTGRLDVRASPLGTPRSPGPGCCANTSSILSHWPQSSVNRPAGRRPRRKVGRREADQGPRPLSAPGGRSLDGHTGGTAPDALLVMGGLGTSLVPSPRKRGPVTWPGLSALGRSTAERWGRPARSREGSVGARCGARDRPVSSSPGKKWGGMGSAAWARVWRGTRELLAAGRDSSRSLIRSFCWVFGPH